MAGSILRYIVTCKNMYGNNCVFQEQASEFAPQKFGFSKLKILRKKMVRGIFLYIMNFSASWQFSIININGVQIYPTWINDYCPILPHLSRNAQIVPVSLYISHISLSLRLSHSLTPCLSLSLLYLSLTLSISVSFYPTSPSSSIFISLILTPFLAIFLWCPSFSHTPTLSHSHSLTLLHSLSHSLTLSHSHSLTLSLSHLLTFFLSTSLTLTHSLLHSLTL